MYLTGLVQREPLFELALRWFSDRPASDDGRLLTEMLVFETRITGPTLERFLRAALAEAGARELHFERVRTKDRLRDRIVESCARPNARATELFELYRTRPEEYFPRTPADIQLVRNEEGRLVGLSRVKRIRRIAEKASRRMADALSGMIGEAARELARERAAAHGVHLDSLRSTPEEMRADFERAERLVADAFRDGLVRLEPEQMRIDDILGLKIVLPEPRFPALIAAIDALDGVRVLDREVHSGAYNDVNLLVELELPPPERLIASSAEIDWSYAEGRGLSAEELARDYPHYVASGARTILAEVILTTEEELIESEFGRSIHEERILAQRQERPYSGRIATNASYIIEYLLRLADAPRSEVGPLPIKLWGRYLDDTFSAAIWKLYGVRRGVALIDPSTVSSSST